MKKREFEVIKTTITNEDGVRHCVGSTISLGKELAEKFHNLGYIKVPMQELFDGNETEAGGAAAKDREEGVRGGASDTGGGEPSSGDVAAAADEATKPRGGSRRRV